MAVWGNQAHAKRLAFGLGALQAGGLIANPVLRPSARVLFGAEGVAGRQLRDRATRLLPSGGGVVRIVLVDDEAREAGTLPIVPLSVGARGEQ